MWEKLKDQMRDEKNGTAWMVYVPFHWIGRTYEGLYVSSSYEPYVFRDIEKYLYVYKWEKIIPKENASVKSVN